MAMLRYADELRKPEDFFDEVPTEKPAKEMVDLAVQLITKKSWRLPPREIRKPLSDGVEGAGSGEAQGQENHFYPGSAPLPWGKRGRSDGCAKG